jgi:hypothetical protein
METELLTEGMHLLLLISKPLVSFCLADERTAVTPRVRSHGLLIRVPDSMQLGVLNTGEVEFTYAEKCIPRLRPQMTTQHVYLLMAFLPLHLRCEPLSDMAGVARPTEDEPAEADTELTVLILGDECVKLYAQECSLASELTGEIE